MAQTQAAARRCVTTVRRKPSGRGRGKAKAAPVDRIFQTGRAQSLPRDAAHPPLRGEGGAALRHGPDRRLLPPLYRPGGRRRRPADGHAGGRRGHHRLSRPRPHAGDRHGSEGRDGGADRPPRRLFARQGRLHAHVLQGEELLRRPRHRRRAGAARHRPRLRQQIPRERQSLAHLFRRRRRPIRARSTRASTWRSCGACRSSTSSRTTSTPWAPAWRAPRRPPSSAGAASPSTFPASRSTAWTCAPSRRPATWRSSMPAPARGPIILEMLTYRYRGHSMSDPAKYRAKEEVQKMRTEHDPIEQVRQRLEQKGWASEDDLKEHRQRHPPHRQRSGRIRPGRPGAGLRPDRSGPTSMPERRRARSRPGSPDQ